MTDLVAVRLCFSRRQCHRLPDAKAARAGECQCKARTATPHWRQMLLPAAVTCPKHLVACITARIATAGGIVAINSKRVVGASKLGLGKSKIGSHQSWVGFAPKYVSRISFAQVQLSWGYSSISDHLYMSHFSSQSSFQVPSHPSTLPVGSSFVTQQVCNHERGIKEYLYCHDIQNARLDKRSTVTGAWCLRKGMAETGSYDAGDDRPHIPSSLPIRPTGPL